MKLTSSQREIARRALRKAKQLGASPREQKALIEAGLVESNLQNLNYGERDSLGFLQQRPSMGWGSGSQVRNIEHATTKFIQGAKAKNKGGGSAGQLAQAVQISAFPERYDQRSKDAESILKQLVGDSGQGASKTFSKTIPGVDRSADRQAALLSLVQQKNKKPGDYLNTITALQGMQDVPDRKVSGTVTAKRSGGGPTGHIAGKSGVISLGELAKKYGLRVSEQSHFDKVDPVHAPNSWHYKDRAIDVSGDPEKMRAFAKEIDTRYGGSLKELFYNAGGKSVNRKNGKRVPNNFVSGHTDHVHAAV